jgi:spermidine synthase
MPPSPRRPSAARAAVQISESRGVRELHLGDDAIQSRMRVDRPDCLALAYTRAMMGTLLFAPRARDFLLLGLGAGSLARFIHRRLPRARVTGIEINPQVLAAARALFGLPREGARFRAVLADGARWIRDAAEPASFDVVLLDAYCGGRQVPALNTRAFYRRVRSVLRPDGVLAVNCIADQPELRGYLDRLHEAFAGRVWAVPTPPDVNLVAYALGPEVPEPGYRAYLERARALRERLALPYPRWVETMREVPHSRERAWPARPGGARAAAARGAGRVRAAAR